MTKINLEHREEELNEIASSLTKIPDLRDNWRLSHLLAEVLFIVLCAQLNGFETFGEYVLYGKEKLPFLRKFFPYKNGCPSKVTFYRVLSLIEPKKLERFLEEWMRKTVNPTESHVIAVDGKTHRGAQGDESVHLVGAFATNSGLLIGQEKVADKSNEITAIPLLLDRLSIANQIITIDAMGCQKEIAQKIVEKKAHYILALKENHKTFYEEVDLYFKQPCEKAAIQMSETLEKERGRVEHRQCFVTSHIDWFEDKDQWTNLRTFVNVQTYCHAKGKERTETRYFISDLPADSDLILAATRAHWGIENRLHWLLDVVFKEDDRILWHKNVIQNEAVLRRCALNIIRKYKTHHNDQRAIKSLRKILIGNDDVMVKVLNEF